MGLRPIIAPLLMIRPLPAELPADADAVLVTSGNAVPALPAWANARPIFAVGNATAARVRQAGFTDVRSAGGDATMLAEMARVSVPFGRHVLLLTGKDQGEALVGMLRGHARQVTRCAVYAAESVSDLPVPAARALAEGRLGAALFFSAETARCMVRLVLAAGLRDAVRTVDAGAIGRPAAVALDALPWRQIRLAARPTEDEMLTLLQ